ncbi:hypothetical protein BM221_006643 [Beauveria bassiana]|uniref:Uncharacterized protein n=1 Tax=Beauveria bassiana TaxID=176275 RepID=A0A2N6NI68_BEABA|nr:hypothetical protein BM221_006643 [Beauveria bassiana]
MELSKLTSQLRQVTQHPGVRVLRPPHIDACASTDNFNPRRPPGSRRALSPKQGPVLQPAPLPSPPPTPPLPFASSSLSFSEPGLSRVVARTTHNTLPVVASSVPITADDAVAAAASALLANTLTTAYPSTDALGPRQRQSRVSILDDYIFSCYDYDATFDCESPAFFRFRRARLLTIRWR